jgi:haloacetate dehalogenase
MLVVWALRDDAVELYGDLLTIWRGWADDVRGASVDSGHHMAEEAPHELAAELRAFFASAPNPPNRPN